jgi:hypothetical protein
MKLLSVILALFQLSFPVRAHCMSGFGGFDDISSDEYAVYSAVIQSRFVKDLVKTLAIDKQTQFEKVNWEKPGDSGESVLDELKPIALETIQDLEKKNEEKGELERHLNLTVNYVLVGKQSRPETPEEYAKQWKEFYEKYPSSPGIISLSRVGFNSDKDQAIVYVANVCGGLCGKGYYLSLVKSGEGWKVQKEMLLWVS